MFIELAKEFESEAYVKQRWQAYLEGEAEIMASLELRGDRVH
jgi:tRNA-(ms[2]io[6]A)-hydroxylase